MNFVLTLVCIISALITSAQERQELYDLGFQPNENSPYYLVLTKKQDTAWQQNAFYMSNGKLASSCSYKDDSCHVAHGKYYSYDVDGHLKQAGTYVNGKKEGAWYGFNDKGVISDSGNYVNGHLKGVRMSWYDDGMPSDSMNFDGAGNGVEVSWFGDGTPASAGFWTQDTMKKGRWKYFSKDGTLKATEDYVNGKVSLCNCYNEKGEALDTALCREKQAAPQSGSAAWVKFLQKSLVKTVENLAMKGAKPGNYTVVIKFMVAEDGTVTNLSALTRFGHGIEEEVISSMRSAPKWEPGRLFGKPVKSYHTQPVTFVIQEQ